nr:hypothetical protein [Micromonospora sp. DSM 115978]
LRSEVERLRSDLARGQADAKAEASRIRDDADRRRAADQETFAERLAVLTEARADARARAERAERQLDELTAELRAARAGNPSG